MQGFVFIYELVKACIVVRVTTDQKLRCWVVLQYLDLIGGYTGRDPFIVSMPLKQSMHDITVDLASPR